MGRRKSNSGENLDAIRSEREALEIRIRELADRERNFLEAQKDAGREPFLAALAKVQIGPMSRQEARAIAAGLAKLGAARIVSLIDDRASAFTEVSGADALESSSSAPNEALDTGNDEGQSAMAS